ncbi:MAG: hypothetical protein LBR22_07470 [Desulfovibrio sp.]|nr:hypothetical protein [Desulfovibrio sp.]
MKQPSQPGRGNVMDLETHPVREPDGGLTPAAARNVCSENTGPVLTTEALERSIDRVYEYALKTGLFQALIDSDMCDDGELADVRCERRLA